MSITGDRIKLRRKALSLSADDVATYIHKGRATVFRYENGSIECPPMEILIPLSQVLHCSIDYLLGKSDSINKIDDNDYPLGLSLPSVDDSSAPLTELEQTLLNKLTALPPEKQQEALSYIQYLLSK